MQLFRLTGKMAAITVVLAVISLVFLNMPLLAQEGHGQGDTEAHGEGHGETMDQGHETDAHGEAGHEQMEGEHTEGHGENAEGGHGGGHHGPNLGTVLPIWSAIPFVGILLSIALFPLFAPHFWHHHFPKISAFWAVLFAIPFIIAYKGDAVYEILHIYIADYIPFIILLWGLFTASGGILLRGTLVGKPVVNVIIIAIGTILASVMGTTGASMVLIRPLIRANEMRQSKMHIIIFFIFLVSNIGGSLTPLGDPPLFLGFLHGVPFFWTFHLIPEWSMASIILLVLFFIIDTILYNKEKDKIQLPTDDTKVPLKLEGTHNFLFLLGIICAVLFSGIAKLAVINVFGVHVPLQNIIRDLFIVLMVYLSMKTTAKKTRVDNGFNWFPIQEVAYLFAGIFMTIVPALAMLKAGTEGGLAFIVNFVREPVHYFFITGALSSFLDNAPTYLTFYNLAQGRLALNDTIVNQILTNQINHQHAAEFVTYLKGISVGAVFFGAVTYIGNAPNFMVKSIAEESKIKMPSFFGYMLWSVGILIPLFIIVSLIFFI